MQSILIHTRSGSTSQCTNPHRLPFHVTIWQDPWLTLFATPAFCESSSQPYAEVTKPFIVRRYVSNSHSESSGTAWRKSRFIITADREKQVFTRVPDTGDRHQSV